MADLYLQGTSGTRLEFAAAITTKTCRDAQAAHSLAPTSAAAMGRLLTSAALVALSDEQKATTSFQIITRRPLKQLYVDCTYEGHLRGFTKNPHLAFPLLAGEQQDRHRTLAPALYPGKLSVVRSRSTGEYTQSATELSRGEIDLDVEHFLQTSDQVPTVLRAETLVDIEGKVALAGGVFVQALPDGDKERLEAIRESLTTARLIDLLTTHAHPADLLKAIEESVVPIDPPQPVRWQCRCTAQRVRASLRIFGVKDLVDMINSNEPTTVDCDLCGKSYSVSPEEIRAAFEELVTAEG